MGYTHYLSKGAPNPEQWDLFKKCVVFVLEKERADGVEFAGSHGEAGTEPEITDSYISFNGVGDDAHETCYIERGNKDFQFCKTARKPYDNAVVLTYALAASLLGAEFASDGDDDVIPNAAKEALMLISLARVGAKI